MMVQIREQGYTMPINLDKPQHWNEDTAASVDLYNKWFMDSAPKAFRQTRTLVTKEVEATLQVTSDLSDITTELLKKSPSSLRAFRMACCPPLAVDRLIGLAGTSSSLVKTMEKGNLPVRMADDVMKKHMDKIIVILERMLDHDIFTWLKRGEEPTEEERHRAATIVADRLTGADANPIIKNSQEKRQLEKITTYLDALGYVNKTVADTSDLSTMELGTYAYHVSVPCEKADGKNINVSVDVLIQPHKPQSTGLPYLIEAKSAGDFTNTNKRRKEESDKLSHLKRTLGTDVSYMLFLNGYFDSGYLGYEAAEGIDWIWEHRMEDFDQLGLEK